MYFSNPTIPALTGLAALTLLAQAAGAAPAPPASAPAADSYEHIYKDNVFDPKRAPWVVAAPVPSVPPPSASDIQLYGIVNVGSIKRAVFKLSPLLAGPGKRQFVSLAVGQSVGAYQIVDVLPDQVILAAGETRYPLRFSVKPDRSPVGVPLSAPAQSAMELPPAMPTIVPGISTGGSAVALALPSQPVPASQPAAGAATAPAAGSVAATAAEAAPAQPAAPAAPAVQGATLLEAIEAARRAGAQPMPNPFAARP